jgi:ubiquinone/menaquinone biosynthesis C-methylase UbiE
MSTYFLTRGDLERTPAKSARRLCRATYLKESNATEDEMTTQHSYVYDPKSGCEKTRLQVRDVKTKSQRAVALEGVRFEGISRILDVGCGTGVVGFDFLDIVPSAHLVGLDLENAILHTAKDNVRVEGSCSFVTGDAYSLPFGEGYFDLLTCQYLLQHLEEPVRVLEEMRRVGRLGAQAIVFEYDDRANFSYPPIPAELEALFRAKIALIERRGGDRSIGRKLHHLLQSAGWTDVEIKIIHDIWQGPADRRAALESANLSFSQLRARLVEEGLISEQIFETGLKQLYSYYQGNVFSVAFFFAAFAKNPGWG